MNCLSLVNRVRKFFIYNFFHGYLYMSLRARKGKCLICGKCCNGCMYLTQDKKCNIWGKDKPAFCDPIFPIDEFDKKVAGVENVCGFHWK